MTQRDIRFLLKTRYSNSNALVIGINQYVKASPLSYAVADAEAVRDILIKDLKFPVENVTCLIDREASKENIINAYLRFTSDKIDLDERIIVFFAGHGYTRTGIRGEVGYLAPFDAEMDDLSTLIRWDEFTNNSELIRAKHMLFIMDACYGGLALVRNIYPGSTRFLKDMLLRYSRQVLTAGKADEVVADSGGPLPGHSVFTGHLLEGIRGKASSEDGVLTANGLMAYVYSKVANDRNSQQTPHYGYFDGDGDFILRAPQLEKLKNSESKDLDTLIVVPAASGESGPEITQEKIGRAKSLLSADASTIKLHDFVIYEVRRFLSGSSEDQFKARSEFSKEELLEQIIKYEELVNDLSIITACIACWAKPEQQTILQKALVRATDRLDPQNGRVDWLYLRWYPLIIMLYCSGIAAVEGRRYDSLANIFYAKIETSKHGRRKSFFVEAVAEAILELNRANVFNQLPGHERYYTPMSEYLFKTLQPRLDDLLFVGKNYESAFDRFEILFALVTVDLRLQQKRNVWGPLGRFSWKHHHQDEAPLSLIINEANMAGKEWEPLTAGLFAGKFERFEAASNEFRQFFSTLRRF